MHFSRGWIGTLVPYLIVSTNTIGLVAGADNKTGFDWTTVTPSEKLVYTDCYDGYQCAKLLLPLDWLNLSNPNQVSIAVTRLAAKVGPEDPSYGGPVLLNPGGPSGSGVDFVLRAGRRIQRTIDGKKHFEIVSFDPRGVAYSEPNAHCFADAQKLELFNAKMDALGLLDDNPASLTTKWAMFAAHGQLCASPDVAGFKNGDNIRNYMSTPSVARDMIGIVEAIQEFETDLIKSNPIIGKDKSQITLSAAHSEPPLVQYWGFSYGTVLGATFITLFPDRVGKFIIDGVADATDYMATGWRKNLEDTEKVMSSFYEYCYDGGSRCPLYRETDTGPKSIKKRLDSVIAQLQESPIPVIDDGEARTITHNDLRAMIFTALYKPYDKFPPIAEAVNDLLHGNYSSMILQTRGFDRASVAYTNGTVPWEFKEYHWHTQAMSGILCGDGPESVTNRTVDDFQEYFDHLMTQSPSAGARWAEITLHCIHWPTSLFAKWRFHGPFTTGGENATKTPILVLGNTGDPVTPLSNAVYAHKSHEGSGLLTMDQGGHCSLQPAYNDCLAGYVRDYFNDGVLPPKDTVCKNECVPWMEKPCEAEANSFDITFFK